MLNTSWYSLNGLKTKTYDKPTKASFINSILVILLYSSLFLTKNKLIYIYFFKAEVMEYKSETKPHTAWWLPACCFSLGSLIMEVTSCYVTLWPTTRRELRPLPTATWVSVETGPPAPVQPRDGCSPGQHLVQLEGTLSYNHLTKLLPNSYPNPTWDNKCLLF